MPAEPTSIEGLAVVRWNALTDTRGFFKHSYQADEVEALIGRPLRMRQGNHSRSAPNVLRGFHHEPWDKFIYVPRGRALCVVADVRPDSPTFGATERFILGDAPGRFDRIFVSRGLANAFYTFEETDYLNDVSAPFDPANRGGVHWRDPLLAVDWPVDVPILSETDKALPTLKDLYPHHPRFVG